MAESEAKPKIITVTNRKGGVGKTTTAVAMASILSERGFHVLLIDADAQCNSTDTYCAQTEDTCTLYDLILSRHPCSVEEAIQHTVHGDIIAGDPQMTEADQALQGKADGLYHLKAALEGLSGYDYVVIDTNPSIRSLVHNALIASDDVIIPIKPGRYEVQGFADLSETLAAVKRYQNPELRTAGILLVLYKNVNAHKAGRKELEEIAPSIGTKVFQTVIRACIKCEEAQSARMPLIKYAPGCSAEKDYEEFVDEYLKGDSDGTKI